MPKNKSKINRMFISFLVKLTLVTGFTILMYMGVIYLFPGMETPTRAVSIFLVLFGVTAGVHYILLRAGHGEALRFANFIILSVVVKLFLYAIFTFLLIISDRSGAMANVLLFFVVYIIFTVFEITTMYSQINRINEG